MKYESKGREHDDGKQKIMVQMDKDQVQCKLFGKKKNVFVDWNDRIGIIERVKFEYARVAWAVHVVSFFTIY